jgi:hypothetical protein
MKIGSILKSALVSLVVVAVVFRVSALKKAVTGAV